MNASTLAHDPDWTTHPEACELVRSGIESVTKLCPWAQSLAERMRSETGTRLIDWVDRVSTTASEADILAAGFELDPASGHGIYRHPKAQLPALWSGYGKHVLAIKVESLSEFLVTHQFDSRTHIEGSPGSAVRRACLVTDHDAEVWAVERHGSLAWQVEDASPELLERLNYHYEKLLLRRRKFEPAVDGFKAARGLIESAIAELGRDRTCDSFFKAERAYWQARNDAAQIQFMRQNRLGLGWANHDHHTYRSSRASFASLISILELLGLECRERFYAGREAGWGAQVLENKISGIIVFADVDMAPEEVLQDFAHEPLAPRPTLGTVGLWCALHGEAFLAAGMHHLECQFDFEAARDQLQSQGVNSMKPFTDLPYLRQAFTQGQRWQVAEDALQRALAAGWITESQAAAFRREGAIGSHLELLERQDGYKGFNKTGISDIISATDPRKQLAGAAEH